MSKSICQFRSWHAVPKYELQQRSISDLTFAHAGAKMGAIELKEALSERDNEIGRLTKAFEFKAKTTEKHDMLFRWRATLIKATPARYLGHVDAKDETSAIDEAAKEFRVPDNLCDRIAVMLNDF